MESFLEASGNKVISNLRLAQGQTAVVRLKKFDAGQPVAGHTGLFLRPQVVVATADPSVAFCFQVSKLAKSKKAYDDKLNVNDIDTTLVESGGYYYFQVCGKKAGTTQLSAIFANQQQNSGPYASSVTIAVTDNRKRLFLTPNVPFSTLWSKHPLMDKSFVATAYTDPKDNTPEDKRRNHPCPRKGFEQCMVRLCTALTSAGIGLTGLTGWRCGGQPDPKHQSHYVQPYDFPKWKADSFYLWEAKPPFQPEPMPGLAAWPFMLGRHGIVLFKNYFTNFGAMTGGHIDLWNEAVMGNNFWATDAGRGQGLAAFFRSEKIYFWPLD